MAAITSSNIYQGGNNVTFLKSGFVRRKKYYGCNLQQKFQKTNVEEEKLIKYCFCERVIYQEDIVLEFMSQTLYRRY